jgi:hypothetical protein
MKKITYAKYGWIVEALTWLVGFIAILNHDYGYTAAIFALLAWFVATDIRKEARIARQVNSVSVYEMKETGEHKMDIEFKDGRVEKLNLNNSKRGVK